MTSVCPVMLSVWHSATACAATSSLSAARLSREDSAARTRYAEVAKLFEEAGDTWGMAIASDYLARVANSQGDLSTARSLYEQALSSYRKLGDRFRSSLTLARLGRVLRELVKARRRGVRVRVILPQQSDVKVVQWATRHFYEYLLKRGIRIFERKDRMLHIKAMVIDGRWSVVGSCNIDARSLRLNLEYFALVHSAPLADALLAVCEEEIRASDRVTAESCRGRRWWQRWIDRAAWSLRKWL